ncbi:MAG: glutamate 5-kinase [Gammaproteobacteria bacterium]|nr:glutamate 5-kinase [Gammaproteobacteria bacterium]
MTVKTLVNKTVVIKVGSQSLIDLRNNAAKTKRFAEQINGIISAGHRLIIVSSGAVALGLEILGESPPLSSSAKLQARLAAVGQPELHRWWHSLINYPTAQLLLDRTLLETREAFVNTVEVLDSFHRHSIIPICNENDAMAHQRSKLGNNDHLAALIAQATSADWLFLITNTPGVYRDFPNSDEIITNLSDEANDLEECLFEGKSKLGSGGMGSKVNAARLASEMGTHVVIGNDELDFGAWLTSGLFAPPEKIGTWLIASDKSALKRFSWMQHVGKVFGSVTVDDGAKRALLNSAASLLSVGIKRVEGVFEANQVIAILDEQENVIAKGMSRCNATELLKRVTDLNELKQNKSQKGMRGDVVVHRNDMMLYSSQ